MVRNGKEIGSQKYSGRGVGDPFIEMVAQTPTQSTKESTSEVENSFNIVPLVSCRQPPMLGLVSPANPALPCQMVPLSYPSHSISLRMGSQSESSGGQVNCVTSQSPFSFKSSLVTGLGRCIRGGGGDHDPWYNCGPLEYDDVFGDDEMEADNHDVIGARAATSEELLMTFVPPFIAQQHDVPDTDTPLSLQPSMCVFDPLVEMMVRTPTQSTIIMESSSEIEIPGEKPSHHFLHVTPIDAASIAAPKNYEYTHDDSHTGPGGATSRSKKLEDSASKLSDGELFKTPFTSCQAYGFVSLVNPVLPDDVTIISLTLSM